VMPVLEWSASTRTRIQPKGFGNHDAYAALLRIANAPMHWTEKLEGFSIGMIHDKKKFLIPRNCLEVLYKYRPTLVVLKPKRIGLEKVRSPL
jgi:hypothetical protein